MEQACALFLLPLLNGLGTTSVLEVLDGNGQTVKRYVAAYDVPLPLANMANITLNLMSTSKGLWALKVMPGLVPAANEGMTVTIAGFDRKTRVVRDKKRVAERAAERAAVASEKQRREAFLLHLAKEVLQMLDSALLSTSLSYPASWCRPTDSTGFCKNLHHLFPACF